MTEKRIIKSRRGTYVEAPLKEVVSISLLETVISGFFSIKLCLKFTHSK